MAKQVQSHKFNIAIAKAMGVNPDKVKSVGYSCGVNGVGIVTLEILVADGELNAIVKDSESEGILMEQLHSSLLQNAENANG